MSEPTVTEPSPTPSTEPSATPAVPAAGTQNPAPAPAAPEAFAFDKLTLPEGFSVDEATSKSFAEILNDTKLSPQERGQKLLDLQTGLATKAQEAGLAAWADLQKQWQDQARADPVIGGDKLEPALSQIARLIDAQGEDAAKIRETLDLTGAGNHPVMIKFLSKIASEFGEGGPVPGTPPTANVPLANKLFPSMKA